MDPRSDPSAEQQPQTSAATGFTELLAVRVAAAVDTRDDLLDAFAAVGEQMPQWFPGESVLTRAEVAAQVDRAIDEHNERVPSASAQAIGLLDAIDELPMHGVATSFALGTDEASALEAVLARAGALIELGAELGAYCYASADDAATLVRDGRIDLHYGVFAESGRTPGEVAAVVRDALDRQGLDVLSHDSDAQIVTAGPIDYRVPFHGHRLHEIAQPDEQ